MTEADIDDILKTMVVIVDTREQSTKASAQRYRDIGVPVVREKLDFGDYSARFTGPAGEEISLAGKVSVERKMNLDELEQCFTKGRKRFAAEFDRAAASGAKMYLLVENNTLSDVYDDKYSSHMKPKAFVASIMSWLARYRCQLIMVPSRISGNVIHDILYREGKELLCQIAKDG